MENDNSHGDHFIFDYDRLAAAGPWAFYPTTTVVMFIAFVALYRVADRHLNRSLELLARKCRMSPALAGLTLLAFGNGASDFFTAILGVGEAPGMILGSSVGSGLFITLVVMGASILFARLSVNHEIVASVEVTREKNKGDGPAGFLIAKKPFLKSTLVYLLCASFVLYLGWTGKVVIWQPIALIAGFILFIVTAIYGYYRKNRPSHGQTEEEPDGLRHRLLFEATLDELEREDVGHRFILAVSKWAEYIAKHPSLLLTYPIDIFLDISTPPMGEEDDEPPSKRALSRYFNHIRSIIFPIGLVGLVTLIIEFGHPGIIGLIGYSILAAAAITASTVSFFLRQSFRTPEPFLFPQIIVAFLVCIMWIYAVTKELLNAITAVARQSGIDDTILGLTVLAWGNSCGDLVSNIALSRNGHAEAAVIAALSGPIQNVLLTIGVSFFIVCWRGNSSIVLEGIGKTFYITGFALLLSLLLLLVVVPWICNYRMSRLFGISLLLGYVIYLVSALLAVFLLP